MENARVNERERNAKNKKLAGKGNKKDEIMREDEDELTGLKKKKILSKYDDEYGEEEKDEKFMTLDGTGGIQRRRGDSETEREGVEVTNGWVGERRIDVGGGVENGHADGRVHERRGRVDKV